MIKLNKILLVILVLTVIGLTAAIVYVSVMPRAEDKFTEFYLLNKDGKAADYPNETAAGQPATVTVGLINHEGTDAKYRIQIKGNGAIIDSVETGTIENNQKWERRVDIKMNTAGDNLTTEFFLYMNDGDTPHIKNPLVLKTNIIISK